MSTLLQLVNEILRRTGQVEASTLNEAQTPIIQTVDFLNETYTEMLQRLQVNRLQQSATFNTSSGTAAYSLTTQCEVQDLIADSVQETGSQLRLEEVDYTYPIAHGETLSGKPQYFYRKGSQLFLYPVPNAIYTIRYDYQRSPQKLSLNSDTTALPESWEKVLILGTQARLEKFLGEGGSDTFLLYRDGLAQLKSLAPRKPEYRMKGFYRGGRTI